MDNPHNTVDVEKENYRLRVEVKSRREDVERIRSLAEKQYDGAYVDGTGKVICQAF